MEKINDVVATNLCTGCGTCASICPKEAIDMRLNLEKGVYEPYVNESKCSNCKLCLKICPGHEVDFHELNIKLFKHTPKNILIGNYLKCYVSHATSNDIRYNSSSGGLITQLLILGIENGLIDGALVTKMKESNPFEPEPFIARTKDEILSACGSKYCPVPANVAVREILGAKEGEKFAVVGLPCHIHGIRKAELANTNLKEKISLHFGIFCSSCPSFLATDFLLENMDIKKKMVNKIAYRGNGWPGKMQLELNDGSKRLIPQDTYWSSGFGLYFSHIRCRLCIDLTCEFADISFGDAWLPEFRDDKIGKSLIISRTDDGDRILNLAHLENKIEMESISINKVIQSTGNVSYNKKIDPKNRHLFIKDYPTYNQKLLKPDVAFYLNQAIRAPGTYFASKRQLWGLLRYYILLAKYIMRIKHL